MGKRLVYLLVVLAVVVSVGIGLGRNHFTRPLSDGDRYSLGLQSLEKDYRSLARKSFVLDSIHMYELQLGVIEKPLRSNDGERIRLYQQTAGAPAKTAWCASYAYYVHSRARVYAYRSAYTPDWANHGQQIYNGSRYARSPMPGDWILSWSNKKKRFDHITSIHSSDGDYWITIGGNESNRLRMGRVDKKAVTFIGTYNFQK